MTTETTARPPIEHVLDDLSLEALIDRKNEAEEAIRELSNRKGHIEQELVRRFREAHPDFDAEAGGSVQLAGDAVLVKLTYDRTYDFDADAILRIRAEGLINDAEFDALVSYVAKVSGTEFNKLVRRGGALADRLHKARTLKGARPKFDASARAQ